MRMLFISALLIANPFSGDLHLLKHVPKWEGTFRDLSSSNRCLVPNDYKHKTEAEIAGMTPGEKVDERLKEEFHHMPAGADDNLPSILLEQIRRDGVKVLSVLTDIANKHNATTRSRCERLRFFVAFHTANDIDNAVIRLRATSEGRATIEALAGTLNRMKNAGFDDKENMRRDYESYMADLERLRGTNITDGIIRDTLRVKHSIQMSGDEGLEFSNFLATLDPTYPGWSEVESATPPMVLKDSRKYLDAYLKFKARK